MLLVAHLLLAPGGGATGGLRLPGGASKVRGAGDSRLNISRTQHGRRQTWRRRLPPTAKRVARAKHPHSAPALWRQQDKVMKATL